ESIIDPGQARRRPFSAAWPGFVDWGEPIISGPRNGSAIVSVSRGRAGVTKSIRPIYADYGTQWQEVAIPPQHGRIKAGGAATVQKQSVLASKLIPEKARELAKRNF